MQAVVGAEHDVGVPQHVVSGERCLDRADHVVDRLHRLHAEAKDVVDPADLPRRERRMAREPARRIGGQDVEVGRLGRLQAGEEPCVARRGGVGPMGREGGELEEEGLAGSG